MIYAFNFPFVRGLRRHLYLLSLLCLAIYPHNYLIAQSYIGIRVTPNFTADPKVLNNSPANISTGTTTAIEAGIDYTYMLNRKWGFSGGTDFGGGNWSYNLKAPLAAFQPGGSGEVNMSRFHTYLYNSGTLNAVCKIPGKNSDIRLFAGPTFRFHHSQRVGSSRRSDDNNNSQYANDPGTGSGTPDFLLVYPDNGRLLTILSAGIGYEHTVNNNLDVLLGLRANWGLTSMAKSVMTIKMNNQFYRGSINTSSNYVGFDVALRLKTALKGSKRKS